MGNPLTNLDQDIGAIVPFSHGMGLICDEQYQVIQIVKSLLKILWFSTYLNKKKCGDR